MSDLTAMASRLAALLGLACVFTNGGTRGFAETAIFASDHPVYRAQVEGARRNAPLTRARVAADLQAAGVPDAPATWYVVPAMSDVRRLPDTYPEDGRVRGELRVVAARGEFEPASFLLHSMEVRRGVELAVSDLTTEGGAVMSAKQVDVKVVKVWFQNANAWISYFSDPGLALVPELLLHDENRVHVDLERVANDARVKDSDGERRVWMSPPGDLEPSAFDPLRLPFADAKTLQPITLDAGAFKQFFATVHVPEAQAAGVYRGTVVARQGGRRLAEIPLVVRVLPFVLPSARTSFDLERQFVISTMGGIKRSELETALGGDAALAREIFRDYLANQRDHGLIHPRIDQTPEDFAMLRELGLPTRPVMDGRRFVPWFGLNFGGRLRFDQRTTAKRGAKHCADFYERLLGHADVIVYYGDEQNAAFMAAHREFFADFLERGIRVASAGHDALLFKAGHVLPVYNMAGTPDDLRTGEWNAIGEMTVGFYGNQHTGSENPQFVRRQSGLLGYFNNLSMIDNCEVQIGAWRPWNDRFFPLYRPMAAAYLNRGGVVDTLQWEGFREGVDDIRYASLLKLLARDAIASSDVRRAVEAKKALQFLALLKPGEMDLNVVRAEIIDRILKMLARAEARASR